MLVELRNDATIDLLDYIVFFKGLKNMEINHPISQFLKVDNMKSEFNYFP